MIHVLPIQELLLCFQECALGTLPNALYKETALCLLCEKQMQDALTHKLVHIYKHKGRSVLALDFLIRTTERRSEHGWVLQSQRRVRYP